jgi:dipeptidase
VKPDRKVGIVDLTSIMRDSYQGTRFDVTRHRAFHPGGKQSPLARPFGSGDLFDLVGIEPERCIGSETSGYVYVSQVRDWLPDPVSGCMWFTLGPSYTSCFAPVYSGVTKITDSWSRSPNFTRIDRTQVQWKFQLVEDLTGLKHQEAIEDVRRVFGPAEARFLALQDEFEEAAVRVFSKHGAARAQAFVTDYTNACLDKVDDAYGELVDYLTFKYLYSYSHVAPPVLPAVTAPTVPAMPNE